MTAVVKFGQRTYGIIGFKFSGFAIINKKDESKNKSTSRNDPETSIRKLC